MSKAIIIGAGKIGRGFIGMELERSGYQILFADVNQAVIEDINRRGEYVVRLLDSQCSERVVRNIRAVNSLNPAFPSCFEDGEMNLVCTSVGQTALVKVAPIIAAGISERRKAKVNKPLNVIAAENAVRGSSQLKAYVYENLSEEDKAYADEYVGFPDCVVDRIVPTDKPGSNAGDVAVENFFEWDVEKRDIKAPILSVMGMSIVKNLDAFLERKLFTLNGPNAITACYGYLKGYKTINQSLNDDEIYRLVCGVMEECGRMLTLRRGFSPEEMLSYRTKVMQRFRNPYIKDSVVRVAREPIRKLSPNDRIIAPFNYANDLGLPVENYRKGIACVLSYDNPQEEQSRTMQDLIKNYGVRSALEKISGIPSESRDAKIIDVEYRCLNRLS